MTNEERCLLELVKKGVHPNRHVKIADNIDWMKAILISSEQGVLSIAFDAIQYLKKSRCSDESISIDLDSFLEWYGHAEIQTNAYAEHKEAIKKLTNICCANGIKVLLLKGVGLSKNYPIPEHRPTGDIDIYLFGDQEKLDDYIEGQGTKVERDNNHHSTFTFEDVAVENHQSLLDINTHKSAVRLERMFQEMLASDLEEGRLPAIVFTDNDSCRESQLYLPSATVNAIYLIRHAGIHFVAEKITLRHILDIACFFEANSDLFRDRYKYSGVIDWDMVLRVLQQENMMEFYNAIATMCVKYLGFDREIFVGYKETEHLADKILQDIYTKEEELPMSMAGITGFAKVKYGMQKTKRYIHNSWKHRIVFNDGLVKSFISMAVNRLRG